MKGFLLLAIATLVFLPQETTALSCMTCDTDKLCTKGKCPICPIVTCTHYMAERCFHATYYLQDMKTPGSKREQYKTAGCSNGETCQKELDRLARIKATDIKYDCSRITIHNEALKMRGNVFVVTIVVFVTVINVLTKCS